MLQEKFSDIATELLDVLNALERVRFDRLLVYLGERMKPFIGGYLPSGKSADLPDCPTPLKLVQYLQKHWDYLNTTLLEDVIRHVTEAGSHLRTLMAEYKTNVCDKVTYTLEECNKKNVKPKPPPKYKAMAFEVKHSGNPLSFHLHQILQLRDLLVNTFGVRDALFAGFVKGCIVLYFFIPEEAAYSLRTKLKTKYSALQDLHVTRVIVFECFSVDVGGIKSPSPSSIAQTPVLFPPSLYSKRYHGVAPFLLQGTVPAEVSLA